LLILIVLLLELPFLPGDTDVTVSIPIINDTISEGEDSFDVVLEVSGIGVVLGYPRKAEVTIAGKKNFISRLFMQQHTNINPVVIQVI